MVGHNCPRQRPRSLPPGPAARNLAALAVAIGLTSLSLLLFEVSVTRFFSVVLSYHFVFLAVSMALLGLGVGGTVGHVVARSMRAADGRMLLTLAGLTAAALPAVTLLMVRPPWGARWLAYGLLAALPFVSGGAFFALLYQRFASASGLLYGSDLVGASAGCLLSVLVLWYLDAITTMLGSAVAALLGVGALALGLQRPRAALSCGIATLLLGTGIALSLRVAPLDIPLTASYDLRMKTMFAALRDQLAPARILETRWTPLARTDLVQYPDPSVRAIFTDAGAGTLMLRFDGDWAKLAALRHDTGFLPFAVGPRERVLIIGPGGGRDVLLALMGGAHDVTAVEINPATVALVRDHGAFNGGIYERPDVHVVVAEGRSFVRRSHAQYDVIYLSLVFTQAAEAIGYSLAENFIYTIEAFQDYLDHLRPGGWLAMVLHDDASLSKALTTGLVALQRRGIPYADLASRLAVIRLPNRPGEDPRRTQQPLLVLKAEPFTDEEAMTLVRASATLGLDALFVPRMIQRGLIPQLLQSPAALAEFEALAPYNVRPATDDSPFFYNTDLVVPAPLQGLLWGTLAVLSVVFALSVVSMRRAARELSGPIPLLVASYFALIGTGYTLAEIALLEKLILFLGWPILTLAVGLAALLVSSGAGSLLTQRWSESVLAHHVRLAVLVAAIVLLVYSIALPIVTRALLGLPLPARALVAIALLVPVGIPLGMPLPSGFRLVRALLPGSIPSLWAINGIASVLGSALAIALALRIGFTAALVAGAFVYVGVIVPLGGLVPRRLAIARDEPS